jgi:hypothetical protein
VLRKKFTSVSLSERVLMLSPVYLAPRLHDLDLIPQEFLLFHCLSCYSPVWGPLVGGTE